MTDDIDRLLQRDADEWRHTVPAPPLLDDALLRASALRRTSKGRRPSEGRGKTERRRSSTWLAVAASVVLVAALAAVFAFFVQARRSASPTGQQATDTFPSTITFRGQTLYANPGRHADAVIRDPGDPRSLTVLVQLLDDNQKGLCLDAHPIARLVTQSASAARIDLIVYKTRPPARMPKTYYCGFAGYTSAPEYTKVPLRVPQPLARDAVVTDGQGQRVPVLDPSADAPAPRYLPSGYTAGPVTRADPTHGRYVAKRAYHSSGASLVISAGLADPFDDRTVTGHVDVHGRRAALSEKSGTHCLTWTATAALTIQVCASGTEASDTTELIEVARSLP